MGYKPIQHVPGFNTRGATSSWAKFHRGPLNPPYQEFITGIELACQSLNTTEAEELRADIHMTFRYSHPPRPHLSKEEWKAVKQLKTDKECIVLTTEKGVVLVVMDRQEYIKKANILFADINTYRPIPTDPTSKHNNKLINILKNMKAESGMRENTYNTRYPTGVSTTMFYGLPKIHKKDVSPVAYCVQYRLCNIWGC